jgi:predicted transcriptional regulator
MMKECMTEAASDTAADTVPGADEAALSALAGVLEQLWLATLETPAKPCSLARLSKRSQRQMSVLMRQLTFLSEAGWVALVSQEDGRGSVRLTEPGRQLCTELSGAYPPTSDIRTTL